MTPTQTAKPAIARIIDLDTAEGMAEWVKALPTENLRSIAARPIFYGPVSNFLLVTAAECELSLR
jgi:hypothetical protein